MSPAGFSLRQWQQSFGLASPDSLLAMLTADEGLAHCRLGEDVVIGEAAWQALRQTVLAALADYHQSAPAEIGPDAARLRRLVRSRMDDTSWRQVLALLAADKAVVISGAFVHLPDHGTELAARDEALLQRLLPLVQAAGAQGAWVRDLAEAIGQTPAELRVAMARLAAAARG